MWCFDVEGEMRKNLLLLVMMMWSSGVLFSQETWVKTFGGSTYDYGMSTISTPDGGYVLTGWTESNDGDFKGMNKGDNDIFVMKLDSNGNLQPSGKKSKKK
jgi:hypothetical protein